MLFKRTAMPPMGKDTAKRLRHGGSDPWVTAFIYRPDAEPEMLVGWYTEVLARFDQSFQYIVALVFWHKDHSPRVAWISSHFRIQAPAKPFRSAHGGRETPRRRHWTVTYPKNDKLTHTLTFRRMPRAWVAAYDKVLHESAVLQREREQVRSEFKDKVGSYVAQFRRDNEPLIDLLMGKSTQMPGEPEE